MSFDCDHCGNPTAALAVSTGSGNPLYCSVECREKDTVGESRTAMKDGKLQMELVDLDFVADMALQLQAGLKGDRVPDGWKKLDPVKYLPKYRGAVLRHLRAAHTPGATDPETKASHWAAVAVNAMICFWLERSVSADDESEPLRLCACGNVLHTDCLACLRAREIYEPRKGKDT